MFGIKGVIGTFRVESTSRVRACSNEERARAQRARESMRRTLESDPQAIGGE